MENRISKRIEWIDIAKAIGIYLMIFNHNNDMPCKHIQFVIASFHMPLFFLLSGFTLKKQEKTFNDIMIFIKRRVIMLGVPYIIWAFVFSSGVNLKNILEILYGSNQSIGGAQSNSVLWFLPCIMISSCITFTLITFVNNKIGLLIISVVAVSIGGGLPVQGFFEDNGYPLSFNIALVGVGFMIIGYLLKCYLQSHNESLYLEKIIKPTYKLFMLLVCCLCLVSIIAYFNIETKSNYLQRAIMALGEWGNVYIFFITGIIGSLVVIFISMILNKNKLLSKVMCAIGRNTIVILSIHLFILNSFKRILNSVNLNGYILPELVSTLFTLLMSFAIAYVIGRYVPCLERGGK